MMASSDGHIRIHKDISFIALNNVLEEIYSLSEVFKSKSLANKILANRNYLITYKQKGQE